jgi:hypothetical protein
MRKLLIILLCLLALTMAVLFIGGCSKGAFVGSKFSTKYHEPDCVWADQTARENRVWYDSAAEAEADGRVPCETCVGD